MHVLITECIFLGSQLFHCTICGAHTESEFASSDYKTIVDHMLTRQVFTLFCGYFSQIAPRENVQNASPLIAAMASRTRFETL